MEGREGTARNSEQRLNAQTRLLWAGREGQVFQRLDSNRSNSTGFPTRAAVSSWRHPQHPEGGEEELISFSFHPPLLPFIPNYPVPCYSAFCHGRVNSVLLHPAPLLHPTFPTWLFLNLPLIQRTDNNPGRAGSIPEPRGPISSCFVSLGSQLGVIKQLGTR